MGDEFSDTSFAQLSRASFETFSRKSINEDKKQQFCVKQFSPPRVFENFF